MTDAMVLYFYGNLSRFAPDSTHPDKLALDAIMGTVHGH